jgi:hypothetical protein
MRYTFTISFSLDRSKLTQGQEFESGVIELNLKKFKRLGYDALGMENRIVASRTYNRFDFADLERHWSKDFLLLIPEKVAVRIDGAQIASSSADGYLNGIFEFCKNGINYSLLANSNAPLLELSASYEKVEKRSTFRKYFVEEAEQIQYAAWQTKLFTEVLQALRGDDKGFQTKAIGKMQQSFALPLGLKSTK